ncbi:hypothetical protein IMSAGC004_00213 [Bacteroidaceae bacterium]|nr:hypothetical protein IMSAGC004_00213 [Bacteroidaceae bacterium]
MLNNIILKYKTERISCIIPNYPYLCIVFFIVLDLRLTKIGARRCSFFYVRKSKQPSPKIFKEYGAVKI